MDGEKPGLSGQDGFFEEEDAEAAAICLSCPLPVCRMDYDKPCLRYRRGIRALKQARAERSDGGQTVKGGKSDKTGQADPLGPAALRQGGRMKA